MQESQLNMLLENSNFISQALQAIKNKFKEQADFGEHPKIKLNHGQAAQEIQRVISLREAFRIQAEGLQANRNLVQLKKEQIEKSRVFLEGLQYYKNTVKSKIKECQIRTQDLTQYLKQPLEVKDWGQDFEPTQTRLEKELEGMKIDKSTYQALTSKRNQVNQELKKQEKLCSEDLPQIVQRLHDVVEQTCKKFGIPPQQEIALIKNRNLSKIFDILSPLKESENLQVKFESGNQLYECFEVEIKANSSSKLYKTAKNNKIHLESKGIKILFATMKDGDKVIVGVDRSSDFTNEQIFHRLVTNQPLQSVYGSPTAELQRNINNKFGFLIWIQKLLCSGVMSGIQLIEIIRERMFCIQMTKYLIENIKKMPYFILLSNPGEGYYPNLKKIRFTEIDKISFHEYLKLVVFPEWILKELNNIQMAEKKQLTMIEKLKLGQEKNSINEILQKFGIEELNKPKLNYYYKAKLVINQEDITLVFIIPYAFPNTPSKIKFVSHRKNQVSQRNGKLSVNQSQQKYYRQVDKPSGIGAYLVKIERQINQGIIQFMKASQFDAFRLFLQINRLLFKIWNWCQQTSDKQVSNERNQNSDH